MAQQPKPLHPAHSPRALFGAQVRALREARQWSQEQLGKKLYLYRGTIGTYERGRSLPETLQDAEALDRALDAHGVLVAVYLFAARHDDSNGDSTAHTQRTHPPRGTIDFMTEPDDTLGRAALDAAAFGSWAEQAGAGDVELELIHQQVRAIAYDALIQPPTVIIERAAPLARRVYTAARSHQRPRHSRELHLLAAQLCSLMAWIAGDVGRLEAAELHASTALACAEVAGDPHTSAWAGVVASKTAFWGGRYQIAADRARRASQLDAPGTVMVMLACQRADAYSQLGDAPRTGHALAAALEVSEDSPTDAIGGLLACGPVRAANYAAAAHLAIGEPRKALLEAERALAAAAAEDLGFGTLAQLHISRALAYAATGDPEGAEQAARPVLELPPERRLTTLIGRLAPLTSQLPAPALRSAPVRALAEEVAAFCSIVPPVLTQLALPPSTEDS